MRERFDRMEEAIQVITGLWTTPPGETFSFDGRFWQLDRCANFPALVQRPRPEIVIGGTGPRRTPLAAARFADEFNSGGGAGTADRIRRVRQVCEEIGRDPDTLRMSVTTQVICGTTKAEAQRRLDGLGAPGARMLANGVVGTPSEVVESLAAFAADGCESAYLHIFDIDDLDHLRLIGAEVIPQLREA
jgi:alkanesulfonate monooxygenase SsuD/methylene tetrahydromethanopterin reductase-like flavin-dependent oxidoreductase (luciferase family)